MTSLTLSEESAAYIRARIAEGGLKGEVIVEDLLEHRARERYDHVVIFGVIEHIPTYGRFCERVWDALKPGGRLYLDASATKEKYAASPWTRRYTWRGPHSCLALPDMVEELIFHGFSVTRSATTPATTRCTMGEWARRLDDAHDRVAGDWGEAIYRTWRVFLWGGAHGFTTDRLQAYTLVAAKGPGRGPRPGPPAPRRATSRPRCAEGRGSAGQPDGVAARAGDRRAERLEHAALEPERQPAEVRAAVRGVEHREHEGHGQVAVVVAAVAEHLAERAHVGQHALRRRLKRCCITRSAVSSVARVDVRHARRDAEHGVVGA